VQGAADAVTWVVGFALIADLYAVEERGRMTGFVMSGTMVAVMVGPTLGGWLYEVGGLALPFFAVTVLAALGAAAFLWIDLPRERTEREVVPISAVVRTPAIAMCAVTVVAASGTISMMEPLLALHLESLGIGPGRIGTLFGLGAVASTFAHPLSGRVADRFGAGRLTLVGLLASAVTVPLASQTWSFQSGVVFFMLGAVATALMVTPSLTFMGEATSAAGIQSFGVAYGLYNMAWGVGLLGGPSLGGFLYDRVGFSRLALGWAAGLIAVTVPLAVVQSKSRQAPSVVTKR
jgi:MFS family permease